MVSRAPLTQAHVEAEIMRISDMMETAVHELAKFGEEAALNEVDYKVEFSRQLLTAGVQADGKITVGDKEAKATVACEGLLRARLVADARHEVAIEKLRTMRSRIDSLRTLSANLRAVT